MRKQQNAMNHLTRLVIDELSSNEAKGMHESENEKIPKITVFTN